MQKRFSTTAFNPGESQISCVLQQISQQMIQLWINENTVCFVIVCAHV